MGNSIAGLPIQRVQQRSPYLNMLIYGDSGTGKTTLAGSADAVPDMRPVLFVDIEGGTESLRVPYPDVETVRVMTWREMQQLYDALYNGDTEYQTVVLDSLTEIQKFGMYNIMQDLVAEKPGRDPDIPSMQEWGKNLEQTRKLVRGFRDLPMHTIFTALPREEKDDRTGIRSKLPQLSGKLAGEVAAFLDIVGYYYVKEIPNEETGEMENQRLLLCSKTSTTIAKDRTRKLPQVIVQPTMADIFNYINAPIPEPEADNSEDTKESAS
jgi:hypothetical protein